MKPRINELGITYNEFHINLEKQLNLAYKKLYGTFSKKGTRKQHEKSSTINQFV